MKKRIIISLCIIFAIAIIVAISVFLTNNKGNAETVAKVEETNIQEQDEPFVIILDNTPDLGGEKRKLI